MIPPKSESFIAIRVGGITSSFAVPHKGMIGIHLGASGPLVSFRWAFGNCITTASRAAPNGGNPPSMMGFTSGRMKWH